MVWDFHVFQNFLQLIVISFTVKGFGIINKAKVDMWLLLSFPTLLAN